MLLHGVKDTEFDIYHGDTLAALRLETTQT